MKISKEIDIPESWGEVHPDSLPFIIKTLTETLSNENLRQYKILNHFLKLSKRHFLLLGTGQLYDLLQLIDFLKLDQIDLQLFENFAEGWTLPKSNFKNGTCFQYAKADDHYKMFIESKDFYFLDLMFATLTFKNGKPPKNDEDVESRIKLLNEVPLYVKLATFYYFNSVKIYVFNTFNRWLFQSERELDNDDEDKVNFGWWGVYNSVAESKVFGSLSKVLKYNFLDVCAYLVQKKEEFLRYEKNSKKITNENF